LQLALFDVDGTLIDSVGLCDARFASAIGAVAGVSGVRLDWALAPDATDSGGSAAHFAHYTGRGASPEELVAIHDRFVADLLAAGVVAPLVPGAADVLERVSAQADWTTGLATGNWLAAAEAKFGWAGLPLPDVPIGSADDAPRRVDILRAAIRKARDSAGIERFSRVVYFGDGLHDVRAARALAIGFVAVTAVRDPAPLRREGARCFLEDFRDDRRLLEVLTDAPIPGPSGNR